MKVLSLFDGMSCGQIAIGRAGIPVEKYYAAEIDKHAIKVTQHNYPDTIQLGDVQDIDGQEYDIDLLLGGSPCQGFSFAGKQFNFEDPRSKLFFEYVRILEESDPAYFLLENVKMKQEYQNIISDMLGVQPIKINSSLVSAQSRERLYWSNIPGIEQPTDKNICLSDIIEQECIGGAKRARYINGVSGKTYQKIELRTDDKANAMTTVKKNSMVSVNNVLRNLHIDEAEQLQTVPINYSSCVSNTQRYKMLGNGWTVDVIAHILKPLARHKIANKLMHRTSL